MEKSKIKMNDFICKICKKLKKQYNGFLLMHVANNVLCSMHKKKITITVLK